MEGAAGQAAWEEAADSTERCPARPGGKRILCYAKNNRNEALMARPVKGSMVSVRLSDEATVMTAFSLEEHVYHVGMLWK